MVGTNLDLRNAEYTNMSDNVSDITVAQQHTDGGEGTETYYQNTNWSKWFGYYKAIAEVKAAIDTRAIWTIGKGFKSDRFTTVLLEDIHGIGNETFNDILKNMIVTRRVGGDAFAEIIRDPETNHLINLKMLDPSSIVIVADKKGIITRYEQVTKTSKKNTKFKTNQIFHLANKRVADSLSGVSDIEAIEPIIKASNESFVDVKTLQHRNVQPRFVFKIDSDDETTISTFKAIIEKMVNAGEHLIIPKGTVEWELISIPGNATLPYIPWREHLRTYFFQVVGIPQIILGSSGEFTESTAKIAYLAFQQSVEDEQRYIEAQVWEQLQVKIHLEFPASIQNELISDKQKDGNEGTNIQAMDTTTSMGAGT